MVFRLFSELPASVIVSVIHFGKFLTILPSNISSDLFLLFSGIPVTCVLYFLKLATVPGGSVWFWGFFILFSLFAFQSEKFL